MRRVLIAGLILILSGCTKLAELPADFSLEAFKLWNVKRQAAFVNSLRPGAKQDFLKILLPNGYFNIEENDVKFLNGGEFICDFKKDVGGYAGDPGPDGRFYYLLGRWRMQYDELVLLNPKREEHIHFMGAELILENSSYTAEANSGLLVLIFTIMKSSRLEAYGEMPWVYLPAPQESPAIADYTKQLGK
jgi:hypothetical protein